MDQLENMKGYKAERDLYEENLDNFFGKELQDQTNKMMNAHKNSQNIHKEIEHKQEQNMIHRTLNSSITMVSLILTFTLIVIIITIRKKLRKTSLKAMEIVKALSMISSRILQKPMTQTPMIQMQMPKSPIITVETLGNPFDSRTSAKGNKHVP